MSIIPTKSTYIAFLPSEPDKSTFVDFVVNFLKTQPTAENILNYIEKVKLERPLEFDKLICHHTTLYFTNPNEANLTEGQKLTVHPFGIGWSDTHCVIFVNVKLDDNIINSTIENKDLSHITFACDKEKGGKPVDSRKVIISAPIDDIIICGTVHELHKENSNKVADGPLQKPQKKQQTNTLSQKGIYAKYLRLVGISGPEIPNKINNLELYFCDKTPTEEDIKDYIDEYVVGKKV